MKLHLKNFRIYEDKKFDLGENGITLISGKSGQGKSTILLAITFALYGTGKKLQTNGKNSCSVIVEIDNLKIYRSKCPNKIVVTKITDNIEYENESAECIIKEKFGNNLVSYIPQDMHESFVHMTPMARLSFLEKFAFGDIDIVAVKSKIKTLIKTFEDKHISSKSSLDLLTNLLAELKQPEKIVFPISNEKPSKEIISTHREMLKTIHNTQEDLEIELKHLNLSKIECVKRDGKMMELSLRQSEYTSKLQNKKDEFNSINETNKDLEAMENNLESLLKYKEYLRLKTECDKNATLIENIKNEETKVMNDEIQKLNEDLVLKNSSILQEETIEEQAEELEELENQLANYILNKEYNLLKEQYDCDVKKLNELKEIEMKNITLKIEKLRKQTGDVSSDISDTSELISFLIKKKEIEKNISSLKEVINPSDQLLKIEDEINILEQQKLRKVIYACPHCHKHTRFIDSKLVSLDKPISGEISNESEEQLSSKLLKAKSLKTKLLTQQEEYRKFTTLRNDFNIQLELQKSWLMEFDNPEAKTILEWTHELEQLKKSQEEFNFNKRKLSDLETQFDKKLFSETIITFERGVNKLKIKLETYNILSEEKYQIDEKKLRQNISNLHQEIENFLRTKKECCEIQLKITTLQLKIEKGGFSNSVLKLQSQLEKELDHLSKLREDKVFRVHDDQNSDGIRNEIYNLKSKLEKKNVLTSEIVMLEKELLIILENKKTIDITHTLEDLTGKITFCEATIETCKKNYKEEEELVKKLEEWKAYVGEYKKWKEMKDRFAINKKEESVLRKQNEALLLLRDKITETQSISISNLIDTINTHAQIFLDRFFTDNPISVKISSFKESKNGDKPCINLEIDYRGIDHDLSMLSGGEMSRVTLAFTLALSEIHNSPLIMLDESTASLDQECVCDVIEGLKDTFGDKLILLIAHQVVKGVFNKTIEL